MRTQEATEELLWLAVKGIIEISGVESNEALLVQIVCTNRKGGLGAFSARVKFEGVEEAKRAACVERVSRVVFDSAGEMPAFLFLDETTLVACEMLA
jgi:hypothetical protein